MPEFGCAFHDLGPMSCKPHNAAMWDASAVRAFGAANHASEIDARTAGKATHDRHGCRCWRPASRAESRAGVTGYSLIRTPKGASAFAIAETIAPAAGTQPDSPTPLTPSGLSREGNSANVTSISGTSVALGMR